MSPPVEWLLLYPLHFACMVDACTSCGNAMREIPLSSSFLDGQSSDFILVCVWRVCVCVCVCAWVCACFWCLGVMEVMVNGVAQLSVL